MAKWEYMTVNSKLLTWEDSENTSVSGELNGFGDQGWEMVSSDGIYLYFKRMKSLEDVFTQKEAEVFISSKTEK